MANTRDCEKKMQSCNNYTLFEVINFESFLSVKHLQPLKKCKFIKLANHA